MRKDLREWWHTEIPHIGTTPWEFIERMGAPGFDAGTYVTDSYAEAIRTNIESAFVYESDDVPERTEYWKARGIERTVYGDPEDLTSRTVYCPTDVRASHEKRPLIVCVYNAGVPMISLEALGFVNIAARYGFIVLVPKDGNDDEHVLKAIDETAEEYPVDRERIFITGHSFGGASSGSKPSSGSKSPSSGRWPGPGSPGRKSSPTMRQGSRTMPMVRRMSWYSLR